MAMHLETRHLETRHLETRQLETGYLETEVTTDISRGDQIAQDRDEVRYSRPRYVKTYRDRDETSIMSQRD